MKGPKISVVTVTFNAASVVEKTIRSVADQTYDNLEYLIIDGASKDQTLEVVNHYREHIDYLKSEPDKGLFDAMNKGAAAATGEWVIFLNADDVFVDKDVLSDVAAFIVANPEAEIVYGNSEQILEYGVYPVYPSITDLNRKMALSHQATFVRTALLRERPFDPNHRFAADFEQLSGFYLEGRTFLHINRMIARMEMRSGTTFDNAIASANELYDIIASRGVNIEAQRRKMIRHKKMVRWFKLMIPAPLMKPVMRVIAKYYKPL